MESDGSKHEMSDEILKYVCSCCIEDHETTEAINFCLECQKHFCKDCVTAHARIFKGHTLLENSPEPSPERSPASFSTEQCSTHKGKILDMFCGSHKIVCCNVCVAMDHKTCEDVQSVNDDIDQLYVKSEADQTKKDLTGLLLDLNDRRTVTQTLLQYLQDSQESAIQAVKDYRAEIDKYLDELQDTSIKEIEREYRKLEAEVLKERTLYDKYNTELKRLNALLTTSVGNTAQHFVCTKLAQQKIVSAKFEKKTKQLSKASVSFNPEVELRQFVQGLTSLGECLIMTSPKYDLYDATLLKTIDVKLKQDTSDCYIKGSCTLDGAVLFTDYSNKQLKRFDVYTLTVVDSCQLYDSPNGVCRVGAQEVAVACNNMVQFVSIQDKLVMLRQLKMKHKCYGIAYMNESLYITDYNKSLYVYSMSGDLLKTIKNDTRGQALFRRSDHIVFSDDGCRFFVGDDGHRFLGGDDGRRFFRGDDDAGYFVCFDVNGEHVMTVKDSHASADGVCADGRRNVIVANYGTQSVSQFSQDGEKRGVVVCSNDCLKYPRSVCFHQGLSRLFVTNQGNQVQVYQLC